ncbi:LysR family transcriptional regulator [Geodermatophilus sp. TF02-6]|nr:LysR family transcriptional regulator [Geodermatophilus sp. TF02-6]
MLSARVPGLADLEMLLAVARTGSLSAAATEVGVTQQALSLRVRSMETRIGVSLLLRTPRGSSLTAAGVVTAQWAVKVLDAAAELDAGIAALRSDQQAHLRVAASLTVAEHLVPGWLVALAARQRAVGKVPSAAELEATNSDTVVRRLLDGAADVGFVEGPRAPAGLRSRVVGTDRLLVVVPLGHPWARRRTPVDVAQLAGTPLVSREVGSGTRQAFEHAVAAQLAGDVPLAPPALELSNAAAVRAAIIAGAGPGALSSLAVADDLALGRLRTVDVPGLDLRRQLRAVWLGPPVPPAGAVRDLVAVAAGQRRTRTSDG